MKRPSDMENASVSRVSDVTSDANVSSSRGGGASGGADKSGNPPGKNEKPKSTASADETAVGKKPGSKGKLGKAMDKMSKAAGGDGSAKQGKEPEQPEDTGQEVKQVGKTAKNVSAGVSAGVKGAILAKFMNMMQMAMLMLTNLAGMTSAAVGGALGFLSQIGSMIAAGVSSLVSGAVSFFTGAVSFVSSALGIGATAATAAVASTGAIVALTAVLVVTGVAMVSTTNKSDEKLIDCTVAVGKAMSPIDDINPDAMQLRNAQQIYSVLSTYGLSDEQVAGVLGNFSTESGIDPTTIEGIYDEDHNISGPRHQNAMKDWDAYVRGPLSDAYVGFTGSGGPIKNPGGYTASDGKMYPGIGMGQYTGGGAMTFLNFAEQMGVAWYSVDFQLAYTLAKGAPTGSFAASGGFWNAYKEQTGGARDMAFFFSKFWEGNTSNGFPARQDSAESWLEKLKSWEVDEAYANSVIAIAERMGSIATDNNVASKKAVCVSTINADNSSIANAAVSYAYETQTEGMGNNGTELYRRVHDNIFPGDIWYMSCDRGVATAVRWSGSDDTFPQGATNTQLAYLQTSDKWKSVGMSGSLTMEDLLPGDVFCLDGHIFLYTGTEAVKAKYPNSNGDSVSASYMERSPGVGIDTTDIVVNRDGQDWIGRGEYEVFRCVKPDDSPKYKNAGSAS